MEKILKKSKPHLRHRSPFIYFISWAYGITNILIGLGTWNVSSKALSATYSFARGPFGPHFYGGVFIGMGLFGITTLLIKHWDWTRRTMMFGLTVKSLFFYGLLVNLDHNFWGYLAITAIWALIAVTQFLTVVYFPKENNNAVDRG